MSFMQKFTAVLTGAHHSTFSAQYDFSLHQHILFPQDPFNFALPSMYKSLKNPLPLGMSHWNFSFSSNLSRIFMALIEALVSRILRSDRHARHLPLLTVWHIHQVLGNDRILSNYTPTVTEQRFCKQWSLLGNNRSTKHMDGILCTVRDIVTFRNNEERRFLCCQCLCLGSET
jgi:hypothetical protein